jgi:hypothetical protein
MEKNKQSPKIGGNGGSIELTDRKTKVLLGSPWQSFERLLEREGREAEVLRREGNRVYLYIIL